MKYLQHSGLQVLNGYETDLEEEDCGDKFHMCLTHNHLLPVQQDKLGLPEDDDVSARPEVATVGDKSQPPIQVPVLSSAMGDGDAPLLGDSSLDDAVYNFLDHAFY